MDLDEHSDGGTSSTPSDPFKDERVPPEVFEEQLEELASEQGLIDIFRRQMTSHSYKAQLYVKAYNEKRQVFLKSMLTQPLELKCVIKALQTRNAIQRDAVELVLYTCFWVSFIFWIHGAVGTAPFLMGYAVSARLQSAASPMPALISPFYESTFLDLGGPKDLYSWQQNILLPLLWSSSVPAGDLRVAAGSSILIGSIRFRTLWMPADECGTALTWTDGSSNTTCYKALSLPGQQTSPLTSSGNESIPPIYFSECPEDHKYELAGTLGKYPCEGYFVEVPFHVAQETAKVKFDYMTEVGFVDGFATRLYAGEFFYYNPSLNLYGSCKMMIEMNSEGTWMPRIRVRTFRVWTPAEVGLTIYDGFFILWILFYIGKLVKGWVQWKRHRDVDIKSLWFITDHVNVALLCTVVVLRWEWWKLCQNRSSFVVGADGYPGQLDQIQALWFVAQDLNSLNMVVTFIRILNFNLFRANDNIRAVLGTFSVIKSQILALGIIFAVLVVAYGMVGTILYGVHIEDFHTFWRSCSTLMLYLMGDFDYLLLSELEPTAAVFFFGSYVLLSVFVLLNFMIAFLTTGFLEESVPTEERRRLRLLQSITDSKTSRAARLECLLDRILSKDYVQIYRKHFLSQAVGRLQYGTRSGAVWDALLNYEKMKMALLTLSEQKDQDPVTICQLDFEQMMTIDTAKFVGEEYTMYLWYWLYPKVFRECTEVQDPREALGTQNDVEFFAEQFKSLLAPLFPNKDLVLYTGVETPRSDISNPYVERNEKSLGERLHPHPSVAQLLEDVEQRTGHLSEILATVIKLLEFADEKLTECLSGERLPANLPIVATDMPLASVIRHYRSLRPPAGRQVGSNPQIIENKGSKWLWNAMAVRPRKRFRRQSTQPPTASQPEPPDPASRARPKPESSRRVRPKSVRPKSKSKSKSKSQSKPKPDPPSRRKRLRKPKPQPSDKPASLTPETE
uniref:Polycystin cation channel PKD1/PKD2 domain-containing protein n=1 Tax=Eutreptiella gymnastica TaxID=73025 RepID=A0A7S1IXZ9_9EUGL|mmetsp:Transcript_50346/g.89960  ORF Transcript_50346/g.89960 Transcript_50346/m.89960 type:complete len:960 (+) Transcript_50346:48-2927(+)